MTRSVLCVKMPIKLLFLLYLQITGKCLCVFGGSEWKEVENKYKQKHNERNEGQMSK